MTTIVSAYIEDRSPTAWRRFDRHMPNLPTSAFGFTESVGEINRWPARYRAAASFEGASLVQYQSRETVDGYSGLIRATLVWAAFERYLKICGLSQDNCGPLLEPHNPRAVADEVAAHDAGGRLFEYIRRRVTNKTLAKQLDAYVQAKEFNVSYLLSAIRHIFGHGHLTPGSNETDARTTIAVCEILNGFHLKVMDEDFSSRVSQLERYLAGQE